MMNNSIFISLGLSLVCVVSGCGDSASDGEGGAGGTLDGGGGAFDDVGGGGGIQGDEGGCPCESNPAIEGRIDDGSCICTDETNKEDVDAIIACSASTTCPPTQVYEDEGITVSDPNNVCLLESLRDRAAGRLSHSTDIAGGFQGVLATHHLVIHPDGTVSRASEHSDDTHESGEVVENYSEAQQCTLKPASYFEDCLTALENEDTAAEACLFGDAGIDQWFESCSVQAPTCG